MFDMETPYSDMYRTKRFRSKSRPTKLCRRTCPACDRKLVNLYYSANAEIYLCKACLDKGLRKEQK